MEKMAKPDSQRYSCKLYLIDNMEDIVVCLGLKLFNSDNTKTFFCNRNAQVTFVEEPQLKLISFKIINIDLCIKGHLKLYPHSTVSSIVNYL